MLVPLRSIAAALLSLALGTGCTTFGQVRAVKTADRLGDLSAAIQELQARVKATSTTLSALVAAKDKDPGHAYAQFEDSVGALASAQKRADLRLQGVKEYAEDYFQAWKQEADTIGDEDLRELSEERRTELSDAVNEVAEEMAPVREEILAYQAELEDTLKYLTIDLTPYGISAIDSRAEDASKTSESLVEGLNEVLVKVQQAAPQFARAKASTQNRGGVSPRQ
jgi:hypothetical protein